MVFGFFIYAYLLTISKLNFHKCILSLAKCMV